VEGRGQAGGVCNTCAGAQCTLLNTPVYVLGGGGRKRGEGGGGACRCENQKLETS
jgi:hypothetical protein